MVTNIGIDVGNSDTKSSDTSTPSGFVTRETLPTFGVGDYLKYNGKYYIPDEENRFPYKKDKTTDENMFILTLFGIAKQIIHDVKNQYGLLIPADIQSKINQITDINLGVGLPPAHCATFGPKTVDYYRKMFGGSVRFSFNEYNFSLRLGLCQFYAQDWAAVVTHKSAKPDAVTNLFKSYYAIDIGGYTVDVVPIMDGHPNGAKSVSLERGVLRLYNTLVKVIEQDYGITVRPDIINAVLCKEQTILDDKVKERILNATHVWSDETIRSLVEADVLFDSYPVVFLGGGASLFEPYIRANKSIKKCDFIHGVNINAKGYTRLITLAAESRR